MLVLDAENQEIIRFSSVRIEQLRSRAGNFHAFKVKARIQLLFGGDIMPSLLRRVVRAGRNYEWTWRYGFNLAPTVAYRRGRRSLSEEAARVLSDLNRHGVAITSAAALLASDSLFCEVERAVGELEHRLAGELSAARASATSGDTAGQKNFIYELLGRYPTFDPQSIYARFALEQPLLQIANAYFGMYTRLRYYNVWHTFMTRTQARESQLWHRDREDHYILKMFVYISDVDEGAGPFTYAAGSHPKGKLRRDPAYFLEGNVKRSTDSQMAEVVSPERWVKCTGARGTIIFADTRGYHKGGQARERDRIMYTGMFTSQASQSREFLRRTGKFSLPRDKEQAFALAAPGRATWPGIWRFAK